MNRHWAMGIFVVGTLVTGIAATASADLTVKVEISGTVDEIAPVLQLLQQNGIGVGTGAAAPAEESLQVEMQSTAQAETIGSIPAPVEPAAPVEPPAPRLALQEATATPDPVKPGEKTLVTVKLVDADNRVDTVGALNAAQDQYLFDLYDDGTHGDTAAGDGVWSAEYAVPAEAPDQTLSLNIRAYDPNGAPVKVSEPGAAPAQEAPALTTSVTINVKNAV